MCAARGRCLQGSLQRCWSGLAEMRSGGVECSLGRFVSAQVKHLMLVGYSDSCEWISQ